MNVNIHLPEAFLTRALSALERLATAVERISGPLYEPLPEAKPYGSEFWEEMTNAKAIAIEEEERREAEGHGASYERDLRARAVGPVYLADNQER